MGVNPIVKFRGGRGINGSISSNGRYLRQWAYVCPICPDKQPVIPALMNWRTHRSQNTRKITKDALHRHMTTKHGAPR